MNQTNINSELLADSRGRKHIPMAVFAVILIHVVLFMVLLIAAGCRSKARARQSVEPAQMAESSPNETAAAGADHETISQAGQPVTATEPAIDAQPAPGPRRTVERALPSRPRAEAAQTYVVQPGDTVGKIAKELGTTIRAIREENRLKRDLIFPGQKLRVTSPKPAQRELAAI